MFSEIAAHTPSNRPPLATRPPTAVTTMDSDMAMACSIFSQLANPQKLAAILALQPSSSRRATPSDLNASTLVAPPPTQISHILGMESHPRTNSMIPWLKPPNSENPAIPSTGAAPPRFDWLTSPAVYGFSLESREPEIGASPSDLQQMDAIGQSASYADGQHLEKTTAVCTIADPVQPCNSMGLNSGMPDSNSGLYVNSVSGLEASQHTHTQKQGLQQQQTGT